MTTNTFLGIPVDGDIVRGDRKPGQRPLEDLSPLIQAVLDDDGIACFGWHQFTPYFNDGEPCVFGARGVWAARHEDIAKAGTGDDEEQEFDKDDLMVDYGSPLGLYHGGQWVNDPSDPTRRNLVGARYEGPDQARYDRCKALSDAVGSGQFDDVLLEAFGDHAEITVRRSGITVEFYAHD